MSAAAPNASFTLKPFSAKPSTFRSSSETAPLYAASWLGNIVAFRILTRTDLLLILKVNVLWLLVRVEGLLI